MKTNNTIKEIQTCNKPVLKKLQQRPSNHDRLQLEQIKIKKHYFPGIFWRFADEFVQL